MWNRSQVSLFPAPGWACVFPSITLSDVVSVSSAVFPAAFLWQIRILQIRLTPAETSTLLRSFRHFSRFDVKKKVFFYPSCLSHAQATICVSRSHVMVVLAPRLPAEHRAAWKSSNMRFTGALGYTHQSAKQEKSLGKNVNECACSII